MAIYRGTDPRELALSLDSLIAQTRPADEVVIVADGPVGGDLEEVVNDRSSALHTTFLRREANQGLGAALNYGLSQCAFPLVGRMDSDDIARPDRFEKQLSAFAADFSLDILGAYAAEIDADGRPGPLRKMPTNHADILACLWANPIIHPAVMYRRDRILAVGSYDARLRRRQDYELWFRCAAAGLKFANVPEALIYYRFTPETHTRQSRRDLWRQGLIGFSGSKRVGLPLNSQLGCFVPFARSFVPPHLQHAAYRWLSRFDPRRQR